MAAKAAQAKRIPEVVQYALGNPTRVAILIVLNEGVYAPAEISDLTGVSLNLVARHVKNLLEHGAIELAKEEVRGNAVKHWYRAVELPEVTEEEARKMTPEHFELLAGLVVQSNLAEVIASLHAGKLRDPRVILSWDWYNVDEEGREEIEAESARFLERVREIEIEATNRRAESGSRAESMLVSVHTFERAREGAPSAVRREAREIVQSNRSLVS